MLADLAPGIVAALGFGTSVSTLLSVLLLGESLTSIQMLGVGIMIAALCAFQFKR